jgi:hypothetical protein
VFKGLLPKYEIRVFEGLSFVLSAQTTVHKPLYELPPAFVNVMTTLPLVKTIRGTQGSWDVEVAYADGSKETLPTAHKHFWKVDHGGPYYERGPTDVSWANFSQNPKFAPHLALLNEKWRVVLTTDEIDEAAGLFKRTGYVGVFDIAEVSVGENGLFFRFLRRLPQMQ